MVLTTIDFQRARLTGLVLGTWLLVCAFVAPADERVVFSGRSSSAPLPKPDTQAQEWDKLFKSFENRNSPGGFGDLSPILSPSRPAGALRQQRLQQIYDQRRNWIFATPEIMSQNTVRDSTNGSWELNLGLKDDKPKTLVERYFENLESKQNETANRTQTNSTKNGYGKNDSLNKDPLQLDKSASTQSLQPEFGRDPMSGSLTDTNLSGLLPTGRLGAILSPLETRWSPMDFGASSFGDRSRSQQWRSDERFQQLLEYSRSTLPAGTTPEALNLVGFGPHRAMPSALTNRPAEAMPERRSLDPFGTLPALGQPSMLRPVTTSADLNAKALGSSSLAPAVIALPPAPPIQPARPVFMEFPRRKF